MVMNTAPPSQTLEAAVVNSLSVFNTEVMPCFNCVNPDRKSGLLSSDSSLVLAYSTWKGLFWILRRSMRCTCTIAVNNICFENIGERVLGQRQQLSKTFTIAPGGVETPVFQTIFCRRAQTLIFYKKL